MLRRYHVQIGRKAEGIDNRLEVALIPDPNRTADDPQVPYWITGSGPIMLDVDAAEFAELAIGDDVTVTLSTTAEGS